MTCDDVTVHYSTDSDDAVILPPEDTWTWQCPCPQIGLFQTLFLLHILLCSNSGIGPSSPVTLCLQILRRGKKLYQSTWNRLWYSIIYKGIRAISSPLTSTLSRRTYKSLFLACFYTKSIWRNNALDFILYIVQENHYDHVRNFRVVFQHTNFKVLVYV